MKLQTQLIGPAFSGLSGYMFVTLEEGTQPKVSFVFNKHESIKEWCYFAIGDSGRGNLHSYREQTLIDKTSNINLAEAVILVRGALDPKSTGHFCAVETGKTEVLV